MLINDLENNPNRNKVFIYTEECKLCGSAADEYKDFISEIKKNNLIPVIKQVNLWQGWKLEANKIGLKMPFIWAFNTRQGLTIEEAKEKGIASIL